jgi:hypothetical protein
MDYTSIRRGDVLVDEPYVYRVLAVSPEGRARLLRVNGAVEVVDLSQGEPWGHIPNVSTAGWVSLCERSRAAQAVGTFLNATNPKCPVGAHNARYKLPGLEIGLTLDSVLRDAVEARLDDYEAAIVESRAWVEARRVMYQEAMMPLFESEPKDTFTIAEEFDSGRGSISLRGWSFDVGQVIRFNCNKATNSTGRGRGWFRVDRIRDNRAYGVLDDGSSGYFCVADDRAWKYPLQLVTDDEVFDCSNEIAYAPVSEPAEGFAYAKYQGLMRHYGMLGAKVYQKFFPNAKRPAMLTGQFQRRYELPTLGSLFRRSSEPSIYVGSTRTPQNLNETYNVALQEIEQVENLLSTTEVEIREIRGLLDTLEG